MAATDHADDVSVTDLRRARLTVRWLCGAFFAVAALIQPVETAVSSGALPKWGPLLVVIPFGVCYIALMIASGRLATELRRQAGDWVAAAIGLPLVAPLLLSFLPAREGEELEETPLWQVVALATGLLSLLLATGFREIRSGLLIFAGILLGIRGVVELHRHGFVLRVCLVVGSLLWSWGLLDALLWHRPQQSEDWIVVLMGSFLIAVVLAILAGYDAKARYLPWRRWALLCLVAPFAAPVVLAFTRLPSISGVPAAELLRVFDEAFTEVSSAHVRRAAELGQRPDSFAIAESAVGAAGVMLFSSYGLLPADVERVAELYAASKR